MKIPTGFVSSCCSVAKSCLTLCEPIDSSPPGSPVPGILQARTLEWVAISFSNAWKWKVKVKSLSHVQLSATPWTAAHQAPLSMGFSRQEYWSGVPLPSPLSSITVTLFLKFPSLLFTSNLCKVSTSVWFIGQKESWELRVLSCYWCYLGFLMEP